MSYKSSAGGRVFSDITAEGDANTQIDFDTDKINLIVGGLTALTVDGNSGSEGAWVLETVTVTKFNNVSPMSRAKLNLRRARGSSGSPSAVAANDLLGSIQFSGYDGSGYEEAASIYVAAAATPSDGTDMPGNMSFATSPDGASTAVPRMTIMSTGLIGVGTLNPATELHVAGGLTLGEKSSDPSSPSEGACVLWMSDGTGSGDDGDVLIKITAGGATKTVTLVDFSAS